jgi:hypothetical protein
MPSPGTVEGTDKRSGAFNARPKVWSHSSVFLSLVTADWLAGAVDPVSEITFSLSLCADPVTSGLEVLL